MYGKVTLPLIVLVIGLAVGGWLGNRVTAGKYEADLRRLADEQRVLLERSAQGARVAALAEADARAEVALQNAKRAATAREIRLRGQIDALENNRSECRWSDVSVRLLNDAVDAANGTDTAAPAVGMRGALP